MAATKSLILWEKVVGGTGIEPVTPTMSRQRALANCLIYNEIVTSKFANCSRYIHGNTGQNRAKTGRGLWFWIVAALAIGIQPCHAADATRLVAAEARRQGVPVAFALRVARVESGVQCHRHNKSGASGPLQIMPASARALGFRGHIRKASCAVQVHWGMHHLAMCYRGARGNQRIAAACHYQGVSALRRVSRSGAAYARKVGQ